MDEIDTATKGRTLSAGRRLLIAAALAACAAASAGPIGRLGVAMPLVLLAPGYLAERALTGARLPLLMRLAIWLGLSLSAIALVYQWCWAAGLAIGDPALWAGACLLAVATLHAAWRDLGRPALGEPNDPAHGWSGALTGVIFLATLALRLVEIEGLALPPWVDSVHHALMIRVAAETGAAPSSLMPYMPVSGLPYHWGYHVVIATLLRLSGLGLPETMLLSGQVLNGLNTLAAAALALSLWRRPVAAPVAALVVGLVSLMPAYYLSWGRYTQLTGLLLLPALAITWRQGLDVRGRGWWAMAALTLAGLSLIHFRVLIFGGALLAALSLVWAAGASLEAARARLIAAGAAVAAAAAITTPWLAHLVARALLPAVADGGLAGGGSYNALSEALLWVAPNRLLAALALAGAWVGLRRRTTAAATVLLWVGLMVVAANPWLVVYLLASAGAVLLGAALLRRRPLLAAPGAALVLGAVAGQPPYFWLITNDVVVISLFMPLAVLIGGGAALLYERLARAGPTVGRGLAPALALILAGAGIWGATATRDSVLNQSTVLAGPADRAAIAWAAASTPPDARFLVNAAPWLPTARRGADGGWWLLPLAGRVTTMPPVLYVYGAPEYVAHVNAVADTIAAFAPGSEQRILDLIAAEGITHIYITDGKGPLQPALFAGRPGFSQVYTRDGVTIFAVDRPAALGNREPAQAAGAAGSNPGSHQAREP